MQKLKSNYNIWLLSNTNSKHIQDEIEINYLFPKLVEIYSFEVGHRKPGEDIYKFALETAKVFAPEESLFIDDLHENIQTARHLGMNAIHFQSIEKLKVELDSLVF